MQIAVNLVCHRVEGERLLKILSEQGFATTLLEPLGDHEPDYQVIVTGRGWQHLLRLATALGCAAIHPEDPYLSSQMHCIICAKPTATDAVIINAHGDRVHDGTCYRRHLMSQIEGA